MKKLLAFFVLFIGTTGLLRAEEPVQQQDLQEIFSKSYLNADDSLDMIYNTASSILKEADSDMSPKEFVDQFMQLAHTPEVEKKYIDVLASNFKNPDDVNAVKELVQNENYLNYRLEILRANFACHAVTMEILKELAETTAKSKNKSSEDKYEIIHVTKSNFQEVMASPRPVIIDVYADWCGPCKALAPIFKDLNDKYGDRYQFAKLNGDEEHALLDHFHITGLPTIIFIKDGQEVGRHVGFLNEEKFIKKIKQYFEQ